VQETAAGIQAATTPHLQRVLSLWDLIYYGVILTSPIAAVPLFGEAQVLSHGHAVSTLLLAMVAMSVTAISFGRMANVYPSAGSVYTYISRGLNPHLGFIVGWAMFLEYLFQPIQNALYAALAIQRMAPRIPFALLAALAVGLITVMTAQGIKFTARTNEILLGFMVLVTSLPPDIPADEICAAYRMRWQIELAFKRLKSLIHLDRLPTRTTAGGLSWLYAHLILALLTEDICQDFLESSP